MNPAWQELFNTDVGLMSFAVIAGILIIAISFAAIVRKKMREPPSNG